MIDPNPTHHQAWAPEKYPESHAKNTTTMAMNEIKCLINSSLIINTLALKHNSTKVHL